MPTTTGPARRTRGAPRPSATAAGVEVPAVPAEPGRERGVRAGAVDRAQHRLGRGPAGRPRAAGPVGPGEGREDARRRKNALCAMADRRPRSPTDRFEADRADGLPVLA